MKAFFDLTKFGIVCFVLFTGAAAYFLGLNPYEKLDTTHFFVFIAALYFLSSGSFALNQLQEIEIDRKMPRTQKRPLPSGVFSSRSVFALAFGFLFLGCGLGYYVSQWFLIYGVLTVVLYNGLYTMYWKKNGPSELCPAPYPGPCLFYLAMGPTISPSLVRVFIYLC